jgi:phage-related baseplate assembly protein
MPTKAIPVEPPSTISLNPSAPVYGLPYVPDIDFAEKDPAVIVDEVILDYQAAFLTLTGIAKTLAPGDPVRLFLLVVCHWLSHQRTIIDFTGKENLLKYAHGDYLDNLAALYGERARRLPASPALTTLLFTLEAGLARDVRVPRGTLCQAPNAVVFETLSDGLIGAGDLTVEVTARCTTAGVIGNGFTPGQINSIINWNQPYALTVTNTVATVGGSDAENDEQYRYRVWLAIESFSTCGPHDAYEFWALSAHPDIIQAVVYSAPDIAGEVWIYPLLTGGVVPTQPILDLVYASCSENTRRPLTDYVSVFAPTLYNYVLTMDYYVEKANEVLLDTIRANVEQAVADWILWQHSYVGRDLNCDELRKRCLEAGAKRIVVTLPSPPFRVMLYNQLAVHDHNTAPTINFAGLEDA